MALPSAYQLPLFPTEKRCAKCGILKPLDAFHLKKSVKDGHRSTCILCRSKQPDMYRPRCLYPIINGFKTCPKCGCHKPIDAFYRKGDNPVHVATACKACRSKESARRYAEQHPILGPKRLAKERRALGLRRCAACGEVKPLSDFYPNRAKPDGLCPDCKECSKDRAVRYRRRNANKVKARCKAWNIAHRERRKQQRTIYRQEHLEEIRTTDRERARRRPVEKRRNARKRERIARGTEGSHTQEEWDALCARYHHACLACGVIGAPLTADHVIPLSRGGSDYISNIQPLCLSCNSRKGARTIDYRRPS